MAGDWPNVPLRKLCNPARGITYGIVQPGAPQDMGIPILRAEDVDNGRIATSNLMRVAPDIEATYERSRLRGGEVLLTLVGAYFGKSAVACEEHAGFNTARAVGVIPVLESADFISYALRSPECQAFIQTRATTTAQPTLNLRDVGDIPIPWPPCAQRKEITKILRALDDKIELNRRVGETLEAIAQALFKSWFVDFDPVRAKVEGRSPNLPRRLADLFPDSFQSSVLGDIPKGWQLAQLGEANKFPLVSPGISADKNTEFSYIATGDVREDLITGETKSKLARLPSRANMRPGSGRVFFAKMKDSPKRLWTMSEDDDWWSRRVLSTGFAGVQASQSYYESLLYCFIASQAFEDTKNRLATGTTMQAINNETICAIPILIPNPPVAEQFDRQVRPFYRRRLINFFASRTLASLRDMLLPRLISGELRIKEAAKIAEAASG
jgi:type I restriction enzyme S subunit